MLARPVLRRLADHWSEGNLTVDLPGKPAAIRLRGSEAGAQARWTLNNWRAGRRVLLGGDLGFAAGYLAGDWDTPDLPSLLTAMASNYDHVAERFKGVRFAQAAHALLHALNRNTRAGSRRNILAHYDLGNDFYAAWLDSGMTYSSAIFHNEEEPLETAQLRKYQRLAEIARIGPGSQVLEIGCGWGGFAQYAAEELGAKVTAITLSPAQKAYAEARLARAGLAGQVEVRLTDYRDIAGEFDAIVSVEMFEAVGQAYWPTYFRQLAANLKPGGRAALQIITIRDDLFEAYSSRPDFIQLEVFPGGMLPTERRLVAGAAEANLSLAGDATLRFGDSYARTLALWLKRFDERWPLIASRAFDERFRRLWRYYLAYCEAGFLTGRTNVVQIAFVRE